MKKIVKIVAIVVAVVLVAAFVAPMLLRGKIAQIVKREANEMLDARVDFEKLDISLLRHFPRASLDLKGLTVVGAGPFEGDTIVAANRISVVVNPMSLFGDDGFEVTKRWISWRLMNGATVAWLAIASSARLMSSSSPTCESAALIADTPAPGGGTEPPLRQCER